MRIDENEDIQNFAFATITVALAVGIVMCYILN